MFERLQRVLVGPDATIRETMATIDDGAVEIALVVDEAQRLLGTVSDGDIRRALLEGATLDAPVMPFVATAPTVVDQDAGRADVLDIMRARSLGQVPVVDATGCLVGLHVIRELLGATRRPNRAVIMAGGRGTRLGRLTDRTPKPMLRVAGRPILERIVLHLVGSGIRRIYLAVNYLAHQIRDHFGDGSDFGCRIEYLEEDTERPLGSGGALALLSQTQDPPTQPILVMNGDLVTDFAVGEMLRQHTETGSVATVAVKEYRHQVPFGVAREKDGLLMELVEKPLEFWHVNTGIYVVEPHLASRVPSDTEFPMTRLIQECISRGERVATWLLRDDWQDIGQPRELQRARGELE